MTIQTLRQLLTPLITVSSLLMACGGSESSGNTVFLTSATYSGNLGGLAGADAKCNERARAAGLSGEFKAWLSDEACGPADPCREFSTSTRPYLRIDGVRVADNWTDLRDGELRRPIAVTELGSVETDGTMVWTNTLSDGRSQGAAHCGNWTHDSADSGGSVGITWQSGWTELDYLYLCDQRLRLYCFEQ